MIKQLRARMAAVCTLATVLVLVGMAAVSLHFTEQQFRLQAEAAFNSNLNTVFYYLRGQTSVDQGWLMQTQAAEGIYIRIEDSGRPLLYVTKNPLLDSLTEQAQEIARDEHDFDNSVAAQEQEELLLDFSGIDQASDIKIMVESREQTFELADEVLSENLQSILVESGFDAAVEQDPEQRALTVLAQEFALEELGFDATIGLPGSLEPVTVRFEMEVDGEKYRAAVSSVPISGGWVGVTILKPIAEEEAQIMTLRMAFAVSVVAASGLLFLFAWFFSARAVKPVEESNRKQAEFISAASHELRSPLAVMQASAGAMQSAPLEKARDFAKNIEGECVRLSGLAGDLLALASTDSHRWTIQREAAEPETILLSVGERFEPLAAQKGLTLSVNLPEDSSLPRCSCDAGRITQVLTILLDNALSYTPAGGRIVLAAGSNNKKSVWLSVSDSGQGIPDEKKKLVFERFYRGDSSRTNREHYGLGLSIAKEITALHKGSLVVVDSDTGGAKFILTLPV